MDTFIFPVTKDTETLDATGHRLLRLGPFFTDYRRFSHWNAIAPSLLFLLDEKWRVSMICSTRSRFGWCFRYGTIWHGGGRRCVWHHSVFSQYGVGAQWVPSSCGANFEFHVTSLPTDRVNISAFHPFIIHSILPTHNQVLNSWFIWFNRSDYCRHRLIFNNHIYYWWFFAITFYLLI